MGRRGLFWLMQRWRCMDRICCTAVDSGCREQAGFLRRCVSHEENNYALVILVLHPELKETPVAAHFVCHR